MTIGPAQTIRCCLLDFSLPFDCEQRLTCRGFESMMETNTTSVSACQFGPKIPLGAHGVYGSAPPGGSGEWASGECECECSSHGIRTQHSFGISNCRLTSLVRGRQLQWPGAVRHGLTVPSSRLALSARALSARALSLLRVRSLCSCLTVDTQDTPVKCPGMFHCHRVLRHWYTAAPPSIMGSGPRLRQVSTNTLIYKA